MRGRTHCWNASRCVTSRHLVARRTERSWCHRGFWSTALEVGGWVVVRKVCAVLCSLGNFVCRPSCVWLVGCGPCPALVNRAAGRVSALRASIRGRHLKARSRRTGPYAPHRQSTGVGSAPCSIRSRLRLVRCASARLKRRVTGSARGAAPVGVGARNAHQVQRGLRPASNKEQTCRIDLGAGRVIAVARAGADSPASYSIKRAVSKDPRPLVGSRDRAPLLR
jgi:hypothetical protein